MNPELKKIIDSSVSDAEKKLGDLTNVGCWVMFRVKEDKIFDEPLAIFKNKEDLYNKFEDIAKNVGPEFGIIVGGWKFD